MKPYSLDDAERDLRVALTVGDQHEIDQASRMVDDLEKAQPRARPTLHASALWYANQGLHVFPLTPRTKIPLKFSGGCKDATTDPEMINKWWEGNPHLNIGIATGYLVDVIDIDGPEGVHAWAQLADIPDILGKVSTPRPGGTHLYVRAVPGRGNKAGILPHVDYRGAGGYVVAPPSVNDQGTYYWREPLDVTALRLDGAA